MNITVSLRHGPLDVEVEAEDSEDYQQEILDFVEFLEENDDTLQSLDGALSHHIGEDGTTQQTSQQKSGDSNTNYQDDSENDDVSVDDGGPLAPIASATDNSETVLENLIAAPEGDDRVPYLVIDDLDILGDSKIQKKRVAALILLFAFHKCYGEERIASSDLKDAFIRSGVPEDHINEAYKDEGKRFFDPRGRGGSASVALLGPGEREAKKEINRIIEDMGV